MAKLLKIDLEERFNAAELSTCCALTVDYYKLQFGRKFSRKKIKKYVESKPLIYFSFLSLDEIKKELENGK